MPTPLGELTTKLMCENFPDVVDYKFTAEMEDDLDSVEKNEKSLNLVLSDFWADFSKELSVAEEKLGNIEIEVPVEETDIICDKCGSRMIVKNGRFGKFAACPNYPRCKNTKPLTENKPKTEENDAAEDKKQPQISDFKCEKCGGDMVLRTGKFGSFYACANYPTCKFTKQKTKNIDIPCPECGARIVVKYSRNRTVFYGCENYPKCNFSSWDMPVNEKCPECGKLLYQKKGKQLLVCHDEKCGFSKPYTAQPESEEE